MTKEKSENLACSQFIYRWVWVHRTQAKQPTLSWQQTTVMRTPPPPGHTHTHSIWGCGSCVYHSARACVCLFDKEIPSWMVGSCFAYTNSSTWILSIDGFRRISESWLFPVILHFSIFYFPKINPKFCIPILFWFRVALGVSRCRLDCAWFSFFFFPFILHHITSM